MSLPPPAPDRTALVTGASSGIGTEIALELARRGHGVTLVARRENELEFVAAEARAFGVRAEVLPADLADRDARAGLWDRVAELGLEVGILVNNAGLSTMGPVHRSEPGAEMRMLEVDVVAVADLCSRFLPAMVRRRRGAVLNVASTAAFQPLPGQAGYGGSKAFVLSYTRAMAAEVRGTGVTVTALCPGPVQTGFEDAMGVNHDDSTDSLPAFMWESADAVARCGIDALERGNTVAIPGLANRALANVSNLLPKSLLVPLLAMRHPGLRD